MHLTNFTIFIDKEKTVRFVSNEFRNISKEKKDALMSSLSKSIEINEAIEIAKKHLNILKSTDMINNPGAWLTYFESKERGLISTWAVNINCYKPAGNWCVFIDAIDKSVIHIEDKTDYSTVFVDIPALVHNPNPLVTKRVNYGDEFKLCRW